MSAVTLMRASAHAATGRLVDPAHIRLARRDDLAALTALAIRSKAHWGYDDAFMTACVDELTVTEAHLAANRIGVIDGSDGPVAMVQITTMTYVVVKAKTY